MTTANFRKEFGVMGGDIKDLLDNYTDALKGILRLQSFESLEVVNVHVTIDAETKPKEDYGIIAIDAKESLDTEFWVQVAKGTWKG